MADEPPDHLFEDVERWQLEENHVAEADRMAGWIAVTLAVMTFIAVVIYLFNGG